MLDLKFVRDQRTEVEQSLKNRGSDITLDEFIAKDQRRRTVINDLENLRHQRNTLSEEVGVKKKAGLHQEAQASIDRVKEINQQIKVLEADVEKFDPWVRDFLLNLPNLPDASVPVGATSDDNPVVKTWGEKPRFDFEPRPIGRSARHWASWTSSGPPRSPAPASRS